MKRAPSRERGTAAGEARPERPGTSAGETRGRPGESHGVPEVIRAREDAPPWEMVGVGRYMPRRIRGSLRGRELG
jgi:hypothetical protein